MTITLHVTVGGLTLTEDNGFDVCVVAPRPLSAVAEEIAVGLTKVGMNVRIDQPRPTDDAVVVLLAGGQSPDSFATALTLSGPRVVPVAVGHVSAEGLPATLSELNWIPWDPEFWAYSMRAIALACRTDLVTYRALESLEARVNGWMSAGRPNADLVVGRREWREMTGALANVPGGTRFDDSLSEYVAASAVATRKHTTKIRWRIAQTIVLTLAIVIASIGLAGRIQYLRDRSQLDLLASALITRGLAPDAQVLKLMGLAQLELDAEGVVDPQITGLITSMWSNPWPEARFATSPEGMMINAAVVGDDGRMLQFDGGGALWRTEPFGWHPVKIKDQLPKLGVSLAASDDGETWAAASLDAVAVSRRGEVTTLQVAGTETLTMDGSGQWLTVVTADSVRTFSLSSASVSETAPFVSWRVLAVGRLGSGIGALGKTDNGLELRDLTTGQTQAVFPDVTDDLSTGALGRDGTVSIKGRDNLVWVGSRGTLRQLEIVVADQASDMALSGTLLLYTETGAGETRIIDTNTGRDLGTTCIGANTLRISLSPNGRQVVCAGRGGMALLALDVNADSTGSPETRRASAVAGDLEVKAVEQGVLVRQGNTQLLAPVSDPSDTSLALSSPLRVGGHVTTVTAGPGSVGYGSEFGDVVIADAITPGDLRVVATWSTPDKSAVQGLVLLEDRVMVTTASATWTVPACNGCTRSPQGLISRVTARLGPCYQSIATVVPARLLNELGLSDRATC